MIKIESADGISTITRDGETCVIFPGMVISPEEVTTIVADGDVVYTIDEAQVVVVPKGTKATISVVEVTEVTEVTETPTEAAAQTEVVTEAVETPAKATAKK